MYLEEIDTALFLQGDILLDFNFPHIVSNEDKTGYEVVHTKENIVLLSQSCDLQGGRPSNERFVCCPLRSETQIRAAYAEKGLDAARTNNSIASLKANKNLGFMYLPAKESLPDSFAVFDKIVSLELGIIAGITPAYRLNGDGRHFLADRLYMFLCRAFDPTRG